MTHAYGDLHRLEETTAAMLADPEVTGDLLLVGLCMARRYHLGRSETASTADLARSIFGTGETVVIIGMGQRTVHHTVAERWRNTMRADIRRYSYLHDPANGGPRARVTPCDAPMVRRATCGKRSSTFGLLTDPGTGRLIGLGTCTKHEMWGRQQFDTNRADIEALGDQVPVPAANTGGALRRHLPGFRWADYWLTLDPKWVEPPEAEPFVPPALTLLLSDDFEPAPDVPRPALSVISDGAWHG